MAAWFHICITANNFQHASYVGHGCTVFCSKLRQASYIVDNASHHWMAMDTVTSFGLASFYLAVATCGWLRNAARHLPSSHIKLSSVRLGQSTECKAQDTHTSSNRLVV